MNIEIRGVGTNNKGAYLMCLAIVDYWRKLDRNTGFYIEPAAGFTGASLQKHGISTYKSNKKYYKYLNTKKIPVKTPAWVFKLLATGDPVDTIFDASGFLYGDQWSVDRIFNRTTKNIKNWKKEGKKFVLLPQAFGPFKNGKIKRETGFVIENADSVFARDKQSYDSLVDAYGKSGHIKQAPDFTNLLEVNHVNNSIKDKYACLIPNEKMLKIYDETTYVKMLQEISQLLSQHKVEPIILCHESTADYEIAEQVNKAFEIPLKIIREDDPLVIKVVIRDSFCTITSRYHGLVSALSQGVPTVATSWSHKYEELLKDYDVEGHTIVPNNYVNLVEKLVKEHDQLRSHLIAKSKLQKRRSLGMWQEVHRIITST